MGYRLAIQRKSGIMDGFLAFFTTAAGALALCVILSRLEGRKDRDGHWHDDGPRMRRWIKGEWQYRELTKFEQEDRLEEQTY